ncbi:unnamed protein product [Arctogadus glacialis]
MEWRSQAGTLFVEYYQKNSPGVVFSHHVMTCLLWVALKAGLFTSILISLCNRVVAHQIPPGNGTRVPARSLLKRCAREQATSAIYLNSQADHIQLCIKLENWPRLGQRSGGGCARRTVPLGPGAAQRAHHRSPSVRGQRKTAIPFAVFTDMAAVLVWDLKEFW